MRSLANQCLLVALCLCAVAGMATCMPPALTTEQARGLKGTRSWSSALHNRRLFQEAVTAAADNTTADSAAPDANATDAGKAAGKVCNWWALAQPHAAAVITNSSTGEQLIPSALSQTEREGTPQYTSSSNGLDGDVPGLFEMLTEQEANNVLAFLLNRTELNLTAHDDALPNDNWIINVEYLPPSKDAAIAYLDYQDRLQAATAAADAGAPDSIAVDMATVKAADVKPLVQPVVERPPRIALATIALGAASPKRIIQVEVGPLPHPTSAKQVPVAPGINEAAWWQRPYLNEVDRLEEVVSSTMDILRPLTINAFDGYTYGDANCTNKCLTYSFGAGFGTSPKQRQVWVFFYRNVEGFYTHPVGLEILVSLADDDPANWHAMKVWFNDQVFDSAEALMAAFNASDPNGPPDAQGHIPLKAYSTKMPNSTAAQFSTFQHRPLMRGLPGYAVGAQTGPVQYEPEGRRFTLNRAHVEWLGWALDIGNSPNSGLGFWNVKFQGERIVYELSLQEAAAGYGGPSPMQSHTIYLDSNWGMGSDYRELMAGVDCPTNAAFLNVVTTFDTAASDRVPNAICVFELATGVPVMRHTGNANSGFDYYGGVVGSVLVVRGITAVYNYDYIQDLRLHLDGTLEVQVHTTGYVQAVHYSKLTGPRYGYPMYLDISGTIHDHFLNWKVDLDVAGRNNSLRADKVAVEQGISKWTGEPWANKYIIPTILATEAEGAIHANDTNRAGDNLEHAALFVINEKELNAWGSARGYRVMVTRELPQILPSNFTSLKGISWSHYKVAATRRKEGEKSSSSPFNQAILSSPVVDFESYLADNENITDTDLVLWVTSGLMHVPGSEDAPVTPTTGTGMGFMLRPFNYFDENAAANLADMVYMPGAVYAGEDAYGTQPLDATLDDPAIIPPSHLLQTKLADGRTTSASTSIADLVAANATTPFPYNFTASDDDQAGRMRLLQPWVGVGLDAMCLPDLDGNTPAF